MVEEKKFTREELARHDGVTEPTIYVAYKGAVYDVTASPLWKKGSHMQRHTAGRDLTAELGAAPHGEEMLGRVARVGVLAEEPDTSLDHLPKSLRVLLQRYPELRRPVHPVVVHIPMASALLAPFFDLAYLATGRKSFEETGFYLEVLALLMAPAAIASGAFSWWVNYRAGRMAPIMIKIPAAGAYTVTAAALVAWRVADPGVLDEPGSGGGSGSRKRRGYLALSMLMPAMALVLGYFGGKIAHPH